MPIPRGMIRKITSSSDEYMEGLRASESGAVSDVYYEDTHYLDEYIICGSVEENGKKYSVSAEIDEYNEEINEYSCTCAQYMYGDGACRHIAALLISQENLFFNKKFMNRRLKNTDVLKETNPYITELITKYSEKTVSRTIAANSDNAARLEPIVFFEGEAVKIGLKIDIGKTYVVKDMNEFYENMKGGQSGIYGQGKSFLHDINNFDEASKKLVNFVMTYFDDSGESKKYMTLFAHNMDKFMQMYCGRTLKAKELSKTFNLRITDKIPVFNVNIKKTKDGFFVVCMEDTDYKVIYGRSRIYIRKDDVLYVCSPEYSEKCGEFLKIMKNSDESYLVDGEDMTSFYATVLRTVSDYITIKSKEDLSPYRPKPLKAKIYLDTDGKKLTAKPEFVYGKEKYFGYDEEREKNTVGDIGGELCVKTVLSKYFTDIDYKEHTAYTENEDRIYDFLSIGINELSMYADFFVSDEIKTLKIKKVKNVGVGVKLNSNLLELVFDTEDFDKKELGKILDSYKNKKRFHRLSDGSFLSLDNPIFGGVLSLSEGLALKTAAFGERGTAVPKNKAMFIDSVLKESNLSFYDRNNEFKKLIRDMKDAEDSDFREPDSLKNILRNYQKTGFKWLKTLEANGFCGILADDMGLGKTLQIIALIKSYKEEHGAVNALVICPASLALNWESEINKFSPDLKSVCAIGTVSERINIISAAHNYDIIITSYELLKRDIDEYKGKSFDYEIIDEAQYIKNYTTQNARAVKQIKSKMRFALTGTPIENNLSELWSIFDFLMPGYLYGHSYFKHTFEVPIVRNEDPVSLKRLRALINPFVLRRLKSDVLSELPEKTETVLFARFDDEQKLLYTAAAAKFRQEFEEQLLSENSKNSRFMVLAMLMRLRQICCDPSLVYENYSGESAKLNLCLSLVRSLVDSGHKMLLFSQFTSMLDILGENLSKMNIPFYEIRGITGKAERLRLVNLFNDDDTPVFLISLKAGGTGLNLTGADMVIHYDPWWNLSVQNQATDRAHRIGQKNSVQVYKLIVKDSIEEKILNLQEQKSDLAKSVIMGEKGGISALSREELLKLFETP